VYAPSPRHFAHAGIASAAGNTSTLTVIEPVSRHRANIVSFPNEIDRASWSRRSAEAPAVQAHPNGGWGGAKQWPSSAEAYRRANAERAVFLRALAGRIRARCGAWLHAAVVTRPEIFACVVLTAVFLVLFVTKSVDLIGHRGVDLTRFP